MQSNLLQNSLIWNFIYFIHVHCALFIFGVFNLVLSPSFLRFEKISSACARVKWWQAYQFWAVTINLHTLNYKSLQMKVRMRHHKLNGSKGCRDWEQHKSNIKLRIQRKSNLWVEVTAFWMWNNNILRHESINTEYAQCSQRDIHPHPAHMSHSTHTHWDLKLTSISNFNCIYFLQSVCWILEYKVFKLMCVSD